MTEQEINQAVDVVVVTAKGNTEVARECCTLYCRKYLGDERLGYPDIQQKDLKTALATNDDVATLARRIRRIEDKFVAARGLTNYRSIEVRNRLQSGGISGTSYVRDLVGEIVGGVGI